jgi:inosine/xanthosine triphosphatase
VDTLRIAVGSTRQPKVNAVREAAALFVPLFVPDAVCEVAGYEVESDVSPTPVSREELMRGARQRSGSLQRKLIAENRASDFYVGVEGGLDVVLEDGRKRVFLESWAYVCGLERGYFGCGGSIEIPGLLAEQVLSYGVELAAAIDQFAGAVGIRDGKGAWGVLSGGLISRQDSFRIAVIAAFAPFYNARLYRSATAAAG